MKSVIGKFKLLLFLPSIEKDNDNVYVNFLVHFRYFK